MKICYCLVMDVLGFKNLMRFATEEDQKQRIEKWVELARSTAKEFQIPHFRLVSDSIFAGTEPTAAGLKSMLAFASRLLTEGTKLGIPQRGGITHGQANWDGDLVYGPALAESYDLASNQNWLGVSCAPGIPGIAVLWSFDRVITYVAPVRGEKVWARPVVVWDVPPAADLKKAMLFGFPKGKDLPFDWVDKANNTLIFSTYLKVVRKKFPETQGENVIGHLPIEPLEVAIEEWSQDVP